MPTTPSDLPPGVVALIEAGDRLAEKLTGPGWALVDGVLDALMTWRDARARVLAMYEGDAGPVQVPDAPDPGGLY